MAKFKRILAMVLVMCMFASALPMQALAAEDGTYTDHETQESDGVVTEITTTTTQKTDDSGNTTVTVEINKTSSGTSESTGAVVSGSANSTTTTVTDNNNNVVSSSSTSNSTTTTTTTTTDPVTGNTTEVSTEVVTENEKKENGDSRDYKETTSFSSTTDAEGNDVNSHWVVDGNEKTTEQIVVEDVTVSVPTTDKDDPATKKTENSNTVTVGGKADTIVEGNPSDENGQTTTTVTPGSVTITTTDVTIEKTVEEKIVDENGNVIQGTDLDYVYNETKPVNGEKDNGLVIWVFRGNRTELPKEGEEITVKDGYEYKYLGAGNTSQFLPVYLYGEPSYPEEEPVFVDENGKAYYVHGQGVAEYTEAFVNGEWVELENSVPGTFGVTQQFTLVDAATGELISAYCADAGTATQGGYSYNIENLEDATYYTDEQAAMIRSIAKNGYWGTASGEDGSLDSMLESLRNAKDNDGNPLFTEEELALVNDGMALTATQMAIWTFSNGASDMNFFNMLYTKEGDSNGELNTSWASQLLNKNAEKDDSYAILYKLYDYMINLEPTPTSTEAAEGEDGKKPTTADTIINEKNFVDKMSVTVIKKAEHENNRDEDTDNDAYVTNLTFALVVTPSTENGDDLVVSVVDAHGNVLASGRIAGEAAEGENVLTPDKDGNYCFEGLTMIEGEQNFKLNLTGIQYLEEGVYLYTSEVKEDTSSQTLVGIAGGKHSVNVTMDIKFDLDVEDGVTVTERVWHHEGDPGYTPEEATPMTVITEVEDPQIFRLVNDDGLEEIPEEPVPLAAPVVTGDNSALWMAVVLMAMVAMVAINLNDKKRQHGTF